MLESTKKILVAIDPSAAGQAAFQQALRLSVSLNARLIVLSVTPQYEGNMNRWKINDTNELLNQPFERCLQEAREQASSLGLPIRCIHKTGDPVEAIVTLSEVEHVSFVLLGHPRRSHLERVLLGRTAARVIGLSPCDVLMVPEHGVVNFSKILVGIDGSRYSMEAGQRALDLAQTFGGEVHAVTVLDIPVEKSLHYGVLDEARRKNDSHLEILSGQAARLGVPIFTSFREGSPYEALVAYSEEKAIELIILGSFGKTALSRLLLGSVVERVATLSSLPTLVVKPVSR